MHGIYISQSLLLQLWCSFNIVTGMVPFIVTGMVFFIVTGMVFFDKGSGSRASTGFSSETATRVTRSTYNQARSTVEGAAEQYSQQYIPKDD